MERSSCYPPISLVPSYSGWKIAFWRPGRHVEAYNSQAGRRKRIVCAGFNWIRSVQFVPAEAWKSVHCQLVIVAIFWFLWRSSNSSAASAWERVCSVAVIFQRTWWDWGRYLDQLYSYLTGFSDFSRAQNVLLSFIYSIAAFHCWHHFCWAPAWPFKADADLQVQRWAYELSQALFVAAAQKEEVRMLFLPNVSQWCIISKRCVNANKPPSLEQARGLAS